MWKTFGKTETGETLYAKTDEDGLVRITAIKGYPELDEFLAESKSKSAPVEPKVVEPEAPEAE